MKLPKTILICGRTYRVKEDKKLLGGKFFCGEQTIFIGTKDKPHQDELLNIILHEIIEVILTERNLRYRLPYTETENGHYLFNFNHYDFENWITDLACALKPFIKC